MSIGLVLGAGGVTGGAYIAGALAALENDLGFDARSADVIVGTSAGALIGALLRSGISAGDLAAWTIGARLSDEARMVLGEVERPTFDPVCLRRFIRPPRVPHPRSMWSALRHPARFDPMRALLTHLADGTRVLLPQVAFLGDAWPEEPFYCCTVRREVGGRVVFGREGAPSARLAAAVAASCAVPGYFAPVQIGRHSYIDGGVHSPTNAAILRGSGLDLIIIISPMSGSAEWRHGVFAVARRHAAHLLHREVKALEAAGIRTVVFAPGPGEQQVMGNDMMSRNRLNEIIQRSFFDAGALAATPAVADLIRRAAGR